jgi:ectoine hydroxylase-related dioxygenase (phytanoyl-CoA dioxygenase family)
MVRAISLLTLKREITLPATPNIQKAPSYQESRHQDLNTKFPEYDTLKKIAKHQKTRMAQSMTYCLTS